MPTDPFQEHNYTHAQLGNRFGAGPLVYCTAWLTLWRRTSKGSMCSLWPLSHVFTGMDVESIPMPAVPSLSIVMLQLHRHSCFSQYTRGTFAAQPAPSWMSHWVQWLCPFSRGVPIDHYGTFCTGMHRTQVHLLSSSTRKEPGSDVHITFLSFFPSHSSYLEYLERNSTLLNSFFPPPTFDTYKPN